MRTKKTFVVIFFTLNLLLSTFYLDAWQNGNTVSRALPIITYFESGTFQFDKYHEKTCDKSHIKGHYYTDKAPLPTYVVLPFFGILVKTGLISPNAEGSLLSPYIFMLGGFLTASLPFSIIILMLFLAISKCKLSFSPVFLSMLPFYGSLIFVFAGTYFAHILSGILLLASYLNLKKDKVIIAGTYAGLSFLCEYNLAVIFFIYGIQLIIRKKSIKPAVYYSLGILPSLLFILYYNYHFTGSPFEMLYKYHTFGELHKNYGFSFPGFASVYGLSFSPYRGLFFYAPFVLFFAVMAFKPAIRNGIGFLLKNYLILPVVIYYLFIASYFGWHGGWTYGPRFLIAVAILLTYEGVKFLSARKFPKVLFWIISLFGTVCAFLAKATLVYSIPTETANPFPDLIIPHFLNGDFNPNNLLTFIFNIKPVYAFVFFIFLFTGSLILLNFLYYKTNKYFWQKNRGG